MKLSQEQEKQILDLIKSGKNLLKISKELGIPYHNVYFLRNSKSAELQPKGLTDKQKIQVVELSKTLTVKQIAETLNVTMSKIKSYRQSHPTLFPRTPIICGEKREFNEEEIQYIIENYKRIKTNAIARHLKCTADAVRKCANDNIGFNGYGAAERVHKCTDKEFRRRCVSCHIYKHKDEDFKANKNICDDCLKLSITKRDIEAENKTKIVYTPAYLTPRPEMFCWS